MVMVDEYSTYGDELEDKLTALCDAFEAIYPYAGFHFGHIVIQDQNWDSTDWALEHLDDHFEGACRRYTEKDARVWREATRHFLTMLKTIVDAIDDDIEASVNEAIKGTPNGEP